MKVIDFSNNKFSINIHPTRKLSYSRFKKQLYFYKVAPKLGLDAFIEHVIGEIENFHDSEFSFER